MEEIKIGSHVGMAGKEMFLASVKEAESYGANVLMLYTGAPQNTRRKEIKDLNIEAGWVYAKQAGIREIVVHAPYIINLANTVKPETFELAVQFLEKEIRRTAAMRSHILVLHPGSALDAGAEAGIAQTVRGLNMVLDENEDEVFIALETMAGKGSEVGRCFEELKSILDRVELKDKIGFCMDACHMWDSGYDIVNHLDEVLEHFDHLIGLQYLKAFHINDSMNVRESHKDRHTLIGSGYIGEETIHRIINHPLLHELPFILETPTDLTGHAEEIRRLKEMYRWDKQMDEYTGF